MAYINTQSFDVFQTLNEKQSPADFFVADDAIALAVSILNKKGFRTIKSCAGHPYPTEIAVDNELYNENRADDVDGKILAERILRIKTFAQQRTYIEFLEPLPEYIGLPDGWSYDAPSMSIYKHFVKTDRLFVFLKNQYDEMYHVTSWAIEL